MNYCITFLKQFSKLYALFEIFLVFVRSAPGHFRIILLTFNKPIFAHDKIFYRIRIKHIRNQANWAFNKWSTGDTWPLLPTADAMDTIRKIVAHTPMLIVETIWYGTQATVQPHHWRCYWIVKWNIKQLDRSKGGRTKTGITTTKMCILKNIYWFFIQNYNFCNVFHIECTFFLFSFECFVSKIKLNKKKFVCFFWILLSNKLREGTFFALLNLCVCFLNLNVCRRGVTWNQNSFLSWCSLWSLEMRFSLNTHRFSNLECSTS